MWRDAYMDKHDGYMHASKDVARAGDGAVSAVSEPRYALNNRVTLRGSRAIYRVVYVYPCGHCYQVLEYALFPPRVQIVDDEDIIGTVETVPCLCR